MPRPPAGASSKELGALREEFEKRVALLEAWVKQWEKSWKDVLPESVESLAERVGKVERGLDVQSTEISDIQDKLRALKEQLAMLNEAVSANAGADKGDGGAPSLDSALLRSVKMKVDVHENKIANLLKLVGDLQQQAQMKERQAGKAGAGADSGELREQIEALRKELNKLKQDLMSMLLALENRLNGKADLEALSELESRRPWLTVAENILERLEAIVSGLNKKMADKNDTKKALKLLEKQVGGGD